MQGVRPIQTRSVFRPFMSQILVTSFVLYYYIGLAHSCHLYCTLKYSYICLPNSASASLWSLRTKVPFILWVYKVIYQHWANIYHFSSVGKIHCLGSSLIGFVQSWPRWGSDNRKSSEFVHSCQEKWIKSFPPHSFKKLTLQYILL